MTNHQPPSWRLTRRAWEPARGKGMHEPHTWPLTEHQNQHLLCMADKIDLNRLALNRLKQTFKNPTFQLYFLQTLDVCLIRCYYYSSLDDLVYPTFIKGIMGGQWVKQAVLPNSVWNKLLPKPNLFIHSRHCQHNTTFGLILTLKGRIFYI